MPKMSIDLLQRPETTRLVFNGPTMGTRWSAIAYADKPVDQPALDAALAAACDRVDTQMSTWKPQSHLMQLNRAPIGQWVDIPDELSYVLALGEGVRDRTGGLFDMAVYGDVQAAGFGSDIRLEFPDTTASRDPSLDIDLANLRARRLAPRAFDLSGIAKGFGVDLMARTMETFGIENYLVSIDGELQAGGFRGDGRPWTVALEAPVIDCRDIAARLEVHNASLATSGNYRHGRQAGGGWVSHTIDPRTGAPSQSDLVSVTVEMPDCVLADAWATALLVAGCDEGATLCHRYGISAIFFNKDMEEKRLGCFSLSSVNSIGHE